MADVTRNVRTYDHFCLTARALERVGKETGFSDDDLLWSESLDINIKKLSDEDREKLEKDAKDPEYLFTVRGVGYRFRDTEE